MSLFPVAASLRRHLAAERAREAMHVDAYQAVGASVALALIEAGMTHAELVALGQVLAIHGERERFEALRESFIDEPAMPVGG